MSFAREKAKMRQRRTACPAWPGEEMLSPPACPGQAKMALHWLATSDAKEARRGTDRRWISKGQCTGFVRERRQPRPSLQIVRGFDVVGEAFPAFHFQFDEAVRLRHVRLQALFAADESPSGAASATLQYLSRVGTSSMVDRSRLGQSLLQPAQVLKIILALDGTTDRQVRLRMPPPMVIHVAIHVGKINPLAWRSDGMLVH